MLVCQYCNSDTPSLAQLGQFVICPSCYNKVNRKGFSSSKHYKMRLFLKLAKSTFSPVLPEVFSYFIENQLKWENIAREVWNQDKDCQWTDFYWPLKSKTSLKEVQKGPITREFLSFIKEQINVG